MKNEPKRNPVITATIGDNASSLQLDFANGKQIKFGANDIPEGLRAYAMMHGLKQKLVDAAAIARNPDTGRSATVDDKYEAVKEVFDRIMSGAWNAVREGGSAGGGLLFRALCRMYEGKREPEAVREWLEGKTDAEKAALRKNSKVAAIIEELRAEAGKAGNVDTDGLLEELNEMGE